MENKFEVGQEVRLSRTPEDTFGVESGDVGVIIDIDRDETDMSYSIEFGGGLEQLVDEDSLELVQKLKTGDRVRVIDNTSGHLVEIGETGYISEYCSDESFKVFADGAEDDMSCWMDISNVELLDGEVPYKFKVGDEVNIIMSEIPYATGIKDEYVTGIITTLNPNNRGAYSIDVDFGNGKVENLGFYESEIEAIEEEKSQFKIGDKVEITDHDNYGTTGVLTITNLMDTGAWLIDNNGKDCYKEFSNIELVKEETSEYIGSDKENEFLYTGGETVVVTETGYQYQTYEDLADKMGLPNFQYDVRLKEGDVGTVVGYLPHGDEQDRDQIVGIDIDGKQYLMGIKGVEKVTDRRQLYLDKLTSVEDEDEYSNEYTVGQYVRIVDDVEDSHKLEIGAIGRIIEIDSDDCEHLPYRVEIINKRKWVNVEDIEALE